MRKDVAKQLAEIANTIPVVFEWELMPEEFTGEELNLTPLGEHQNFPKHEKYQVSMPALVANMHRQQLKDAYKKGGIKAVEMYREDVVRRIEAGEVGVAKMQNGKIEIITISK